LQREPRRNDEVRYALRDLETTLRMYIEAWRQEFGLGKTRHDSLRQDCLLHGTSYAVHEARHLMLDRR
jgi:hypothetical protein